MKSLASKLIKAVLRKAGYELHKIQFSPMTRLLGATQLPVRTILDVGANEGQFARMISSYFPQAAMYCFEPVPEAFAVLEDWAATQHGRVMPIKCALGEVEGSLTMLKHDQHTSSSSFLATTTRCEEIYPETRAKSSISVDCHTLDNAVGRFSLALKPDILIKLDVQGYEDRVIKGGQQTFPKANVVILEVSLVPLYETQPTFAQVAGRMEALDFDYAGSLEQPCNGEGRLLSIDAVFFKRK